MLHSGLPSAMVSAAQMGEPESLEGRVLGGRYRLEHQLGEGGFGTIWRAEQLVLGATVAIKLIDMAIARQPGALERFLREAQAAATLRSPHVVQVLDYGVDGDQPFIAMELLEGETLAQRIHRLGRLAPSEALRIVTHVARAMSRAHECNIVHRDLKPDNVFLVHNEDEEVAKVLDFGVAKITNPDWVNESTQTRTGSLIGTPHYMSPEQVQGNKTVDYRSDLWSLGVIAFEMFTGQRPFVGNALGDLVLQICVREIQKPSRLAPVPLGFDEWFLKASERDPEQRFQSARDLAQSLREVVGGGERNVELVVADDMELFREASTNNVSGRASEGAAAEGAVKASSHLEYAPTIRGGPVSATSLDGQRVVTPAPNTEEPGLSTVSGQSKSPRLVLILMLGAAILAVAAWSAGFWKSKPQAPSRTSFVAASASAAGSSDRRVIDDARATETSVESNAAPDESARADRSAARVPSARVATPSESARRPAAPRGGPSAGAKLPNGQSKGPEASSSSRAGARPSAAAASSAPVVANVTAPAASSPSRAAEPVASPNLQVPSATVE
jgi:serine/threonine protein kinase